MIAELEARAAALRRRYQGRQGLLAAGDIALEEGCSAKSAARLMRSGALGAVYEKNARVRRIFVDGYIRYLERRTIIMKSSA